MNRQQRRAEERASHSVVTTTERGRYASDVDIYRGRLDAVLDVLNVILLAHGSGPECRLVVGKGYLDAAKLRRVVHTEVSEEGNLVVYLGKPKEELTDGNKYARR